MKRCRVCLLACLLFALTGCFEDTPLYVSDGEIEGTWKKEGTREYWSYHADHTGAKWDASEGFSEDFPTYSYTWSISGGNRLNYTTTGDTIDVPITRTYIITEISDNTMVREEELGTYTLHKVGGKKS